MNCNVQVLVLSAKSNGVGHDIHCILRVCCILGYKHDFENLVCTRLRLKYNNMSAIKKYEYEYGVKQ